MRCERHRRARPALGTLVDITLDAANVARAMPAFEAAFAEVARIHALMSAHDERSDVMRLSRRAHLEPVHVHADTLAVLRLAMRLYELSDGVFDPAVGALMARAGYVPPVELDSQAMRGSLADVVIADDGAVMFRRPLHLDFGGIAKGYAVDCAVQALSALDVAGALVNAGGDMRAFGVAEHRVQLRTAQGLSTIALLKDAALASSCHADRHASRTSPHLDARSGYAVDRQDSIVVHAPYAAVADALTKVAMVSATLADRACEALGAQWRAFAFHIA